MFNMCKNWRWYHLGLPWYRMFSELLLNEIIIEQCRYFKIEIITIDFQQLKCTQQVPTKRELEIKTFRSKNSCKIIIKIPLQVNPYMPIYLGPSAGSWTICVGTWAPEMTDFIPCQIATKISGNLHEPNLHLEPPPVASYRAVLWEPQRYLVYTSFTSSS